MVDGHPAGRLGVRAQADRLLMLSTIGANAVTTSWLQNVNTVSRCIAERVFGSAAMITRSAASAANRFAPPTRWPAGRTAPHPDHDGALSDGHHVTALEVAAPWSCGSPLGLEPDVVVSSLNAGWKL